MFTAKSSNQYWRSKSQAGQEFRSRNNLPSTVLRIEAGSSSVGSGVANRRVMISLLRASGTIVKTCFAVSIAGMVIVIPLAGI